MTPRPSAQAPLHVLVVVHGIGDQTEFATLQQLVNLCLGQIDAPKGVPIGRLHSELRPPAPHGAPPPPPHGAPPPPAPPPPAWAALSSLPGLGFAEVFWADIGRANESYCLEDTTRWIDTIVERVGVIDDRTARRRARLRERDREPAREGDIDYDAVRSVLHDVALFIRLARFVNHGLAVAGVGSVELDKTMTRFLGDIQLFAEFASARDAIMRRFHDAMSRIHAQAAATGRPAEISICGHSQGSVIAFLGMLEGHRDRAAAGVPAGAHWLDRVKSFMTIGSPIDKFLVLWPELFDAFVGVRRAAGPRGIVWRNYADLGDPVGYELDTARVFCERAVPALFEPGAPRDALFRRYLIPGKAHIDYWDDQPVFAEWLGGDVGLGAPGTPPADDPIVKRVAPLVLFLLPAAFAVGAAHIFGSALGAIGVRFGLEQVLVVALLILGHVALSGAFRSSRRKLWPAIGMTLFVAGAALTLLEFGGHPAVQLTIVALFGGALLTCALDGMGRRRA